MSADGLADAPLVTGERQVQLGRTSLMIPRLGVGTASWGESSGRPRFNLTRAAYGPAGGADELRRAVDVSVAAGTALFDTAGMYGGGASELSVGASTRGRPAVIATKFPSRLLASRARDLPRALEESVSRLCRPVDLYQVHSPFPWLSIPAVMHAMADAVAAGKIRAVGVCNFSAAQLRLAHQELAARGVPLASNQVEYSLLHRAPETDGVLDACRELGVTLIAYMPLALGALTGQYSTAHRPVGLRRFTRTFRGRNLDGIAPVTQLLDRLAHRYSRSPAQVALRWLLHQDNVVPIPGAKNGAQAAHNAGALTFTLQASEIQALNHVTLPWGR